MFMTGVYALFAVLRYIYISTEITITSFTFKHIQIMLVVKIEPSIHNFIW